MTQEDCECTVCSNCEKRFRCGMHRDILTEEMAAFEDALDDIREAWRLIYEKSYPVR